MKKLILILSYGISIIIAKTFTVSEPPMVYIYHFVSYDTTSVIMHGGDADESQNKMLRLPMFNEYDIPEDKWYDKKNNNVMLGKPLNPKLVSAMLTSAVARNKHISIAGESMQERIKVDNFMTILKSYEYPKNTDFIFIGEINTVATQYEIDLKLIDVSRQHIVASNSFHIPFEEISGLRNYIDELVEPLMEKIVKPFIGSVYIRVDSTSREKIRWDDISIRPLKKVVGFNLSNTVDSDFTPYKTITMDPDFHESHFAILEQYDEGDYRLVVDTDERRSFLSGNYHFRAFLKNNEEPFETDFIVRAGDLNEIHISLPYIPPPQDTDGDGIIDDLDACPDLVGLPNDNPDLHGCPQELYGNIKITNIWDGVAFELLKLSDSIEDSVIVFGKFQNNLLDIHTGSFNYIYDDQNNSITIYDLPLGKYFRIGSAVPVEAFPGKYYVNMFFDSDTISLDKKGITRKTNIADQSKINGREVIIYFDPFTPLPEDAYKLYFDDNLTYFTIVKVLGELHVVGFPINYSGNITAKREGFLDSEISIEAGSKKAYYVADLTIPENGKVNQKVVDKPLEVKRKKNNNFLKLLGRIRNSCSNIVTLITFGTIII